MQELTGWCLPAGAGTEAGFMLTLPGLLLLLLLSLLSDWPEPELSRYFCSFAESSLESLSEPPFSILTLATRESLSD